MRTLNLLYLIVIVSFISCQKDDEMDFRTRWEIRECHIEGLRQNLDPSISILGSWEWAFVRSNNFGPDFKLYDGLQLNFTGNNVLEVTSEHGREEVNWRFHGNGFKLFVDSGRLFNPVVGETTVYLCEDEMMITSELDPPQLLNDIANTFVRR